MNHWGRLPLAPCASMHACCCTSEPKMKAGIHAVEASLHLNSVDTLTVSCHMFSLCNKATKEGEERGRNDERSKINKRKKERTSSITCELIASKKTPKQYDKERGQYAHRASCHLHVLCLCGWCVYVCVRFADECQLGRQSERPALPQRQSTPDATSQKCHLSLQNNLSPRSHHLTDFLTFPIDSYTSDNVCVSHRHLDILVTLHTDLTLVYSPVY